MPKSKDPQPEPEPRDVTQEDVDAAVWAATHDEQGNPKPITPGANPIVQ